MRRVAAFVITSLFSVFAAGAAAQSLPPTLTGESFHGGAPTITSVACQLGNIGGSFQASGTAIGPYPGTFQETGSVIGPEPATFTASFTIDSSIGRVTGTKRGVVLGAACAPDGSFLSFGSQGPGFLSSDTYDATIFSAIGAFGDNGLFQFSFEQGTTPTPHFDQSFSSALASPRPLFPTSTAQCKNGGWRNFPQFKNQGQCVRFVETGK